MAERLLLMRYSHPCQLQPADKVCAKAAGRQRPLDPPPSAGFIYLFLFQARLRLVRAKFSFLNGRTGSRVHRYKRERLQARLNLCGKKNKKTKKRPRFFFPQLNNVTDSDRRSYRLTNGFRTEKSGIFHVWLRLHHTDKPHS